MESLALSCYAVPLHIVDAASAGVLDQLPGLLAPECTPRAAPEPGATSLRIEADAGGRYRLHRDGVDIATLDDDVVLLARLRQEVDNAVARRSRRWLFLHAGVVGWRGLAILVPGRSFTGKSSLVAALVRQGATYYSDEFAALDADGLVHPYRRLPGLRTPLAVDQGLRLLREDLPARPLPVAVVLSTTYQDGLNWRPTVVQGIRATLPLIDNAVLAREAADDLLRLAARMAPGLVALQGPRGEAGEVAARLLDLVDAAVAGHALGGAPPDPVRRADDLARIARTRLAAPAPLPLPPGRQLTASPWLRVPDLLAPAEHQQLIAFTLANPDRFAPSGVINRHGQGEVDPGDRSSSSFRGGTTAEVWALFEQRLHAILPAVRKALGVPHFRLCSIERQLTAHRDGGCFAPHIDDGSADTRGRRISAVYCFQARPQAFSGGALKLYDWWDTPAGRTPAGTCTRLAPLDNSLLLFRSCDLHEVEPVQCQSADFDNSRFTVLIWFRDDETPPSTPADQAAAANLVASETACSDTPTAPPTDG